MCLRSYHITPQINWLRLHSIMTRDHHLDIFRTFTSIRIPRCLGCNNAILIVHYRRMTQRHTPIRNRSTVLDCSFGLATRSSMGTLRTSRTVSTDFHPTTIVMRTHHRIGIGVSMESIGSVVIRAFIIVSAPLLSLCISTSVTRASMNLAVTDKSCVFLNTLHTCPR